MAGMATDVRKCMRLLMRLGPARGYFAEPSKLIYIGKPQDEGVARAILDEFEFKYTEGARYIGSFIRSKQSQQSWLQPKIPEWVANVKFFGKVALK